uniref:60S ribosomal protein L26 n=1 Tax=Rhabditophanes sp. KR3021 TaxID=114890 RepID=A0AC35UE31_9BILA
MLVKELLAKVPKSNDGRKNVHGLYVPKDCVLNVQKKGVYARKVNRYVFLSHKIDVMQKLYKVGSHVDVHNTDVNGNRVLSKKQERMKKIIDTRKDDGPKYQTVAVKRSQVTNVGHGKCTIEEVYSLSPASAKLLG